MTEGLIVLWSWMVLATSLGLLMFYIMSILRLLYQQVNSMQKYTTINSLAATLVEVNKDRLHNINTRLDEMLTTDAL